MILYQTDNINPPLGKTLIQNIWPDFENMKTLFQTFGGEILKIWKPWKNAREAREKFLGFFRRFTRENR